MVYFEERIEEGINEISFSHINTGEPQTYLLNSK